MPASAPKSAARADDNLNAVLWMQASVEYRASAVTIYRAAADRLDRALKEKHWDALVPDERGNAATGLPPAVIMDVDETVLDNSPYQARLIRDGKEFDEVTWDAWVAEKKAKPVPGVVDFAKAAAAKGVTILYLSNRAEHLQEATLANLRAAGLPVKDDSVFLGLGTVVDDCEQNGSEKNCRRRLAGQKYRVLMQFGDQIGDFVQVVANTPAGRIAAAGRVPRLVRRALVDAAQPQLRRLGAGVVQQRLRPAARSAPRSQAPGAGRGALSGLGAAHDNIKSFKFNNLNDIS